jgi:hypothetical protein
LYFSQPQEVDEVRRAIGHAVIERNDALQREVAALAEIVDDFRRQNCARAEERQTRLAKRNQLLVGASGERRLLEQQIRLLLREAAGSAVKQQPGDARVAEYVLGGGAASVPSSARPASALSTSRSTGGRVSARSCPTLVLEGGLVLDRGRGPGGGGGGGGGGPFTAASVVGGVVLALRAAFQEEEADLLAEVRV